MRRRTSSLLLPALTLCLAFALPAAATAQSAGDNQYVDPFAGSEPPANKPKGGGGNGGNQQAGAAPATPSASISQPTATPSAVVDPATGSADSSVPQLPATGAPVLLMLASGAALFAAGYALRLAVRSRPT
jgi:hypothetical protein